jgi:hypothetical protein
VDDVTTPSWVADVSRAAEIVETTGGPVDEQARAELIAAAGRILAVLDPQPDQYQVEELAMMMAASIAAGATAAGAVLRSTEIRDVRLPAVAAVFGLLLGKRIRPPTR